MDSNPYAAPLAAPLDAAPVSDAEAVRRAHIGHEASVKSIGTLYYLGAIGLTLAALAFGSVTGRLPEAPDGNHAGAWVMPIVFVALAALQFALGRGLRRLNSAARATCAIFAAIGLVGFPIGTIINGYILYLLFSKKGGMVFSPHYKDIIALTPHVRYKTSIVVWVILGIVVLAIIAGAVALMLGH